MRPLIALLINRIMRHRAGRWALSVLFLAIAVVAFASYLSAVAGSNSEALVALLTCIFFAALGFFALFVTLRMESLERGRQQALTSTRAQVEQLKERGEPMEIPPVPPPAVGMAESRYRQVDEYIERMKKLPWATTPTVSAEEAPLALNRTIAQVRGIRGDWSQLSGPIDTFLTLPSPYAWVGAAEVMHRLSYLQGKVFAPRGLQQGLRFAGAAQLNTPSQPDALIIRARLLASTNSLIWLPLAEKTIDRLRSVAPNHPRLPDAEAYLYLRQKKYDEAIKCFDQLIANPPSQEERFAALANKASALQDANRNDEALEAYHIAIGENPHDAWVLLNQANLLMTMGRYQEALDSNARSLAVMDLAIARTQRQSILDKMRATGGLPSL